jgi:uncharacterized membrane protein
MISRDPGPAVRPAAPGTGQPPANVTAGSPPVLATAPDATTQGTRTLALALLLALIALGLAWELWLAPTGSGTLAIKVLPLALCVLGLWRHRMYTFRWLSLLIWLYVAEGITRAVTETGISRTLAVGEIVLSVALFGVSAFYIRWRLRRGRELAAASAQRDADSGSVPAPGPASPR